MEVGKIKPEAYFFLYGLIVVQRNAKCRRGQAEANYKERCRQYRPQ